MSRFFKRVTIMYIYAEISLIETKKDISAKGNEYDKKVNFIKEAGVECK